MPGPLAEWSLGDLERFLQDRLQVELRGAARRLWLPGDLKASAKGVADAGWLLCGGQAVSRSVFSVLFAAVGTVWGAGDGVSTFNVPDLRGRVPVGLDNLGGVDAARLSVANTLGGSGGEERHVLTVAELAVHRHTVNTTATGAAILGLTPLVGSVTGTVDTSDAGGGVAHNNMQPFALVSWLVKT